MAKGQTTLDIPQNDERRYMPRWETENRVIYQRESGKDYREGRSRDFHFAGACISTDESLPVNQKLRLTIFLSGNESVQVNGTVLWSRSVGAQYLIGINFYEVSKRVQDTLLKYAFEVKKEDLIKHWYEGWNSP